MKKLPFALAALSAFTLCAGGAGAQLKTGAPAPDFSARAARGGEVSDFRLRTALDRGPVVVYFFPKSFTSGCTIEAHAFSDRIADFQKLGATVIGISADTIETQKKFSTQECRSKFLVASDPGLKIARSYDAVIMALFTNRTSYVIAPDGKIVESYSNFEPLGHIDNALHALQELKK